MHSTNVWDMRRSGNRKDGTIVTSDRAQLSNQHHLKIHDVGKSRTCYQEIVSRLEKMIGVVSGQRCRRVETPDSASLNRRSVNDCAGRIGGAIRAIGAGAENDHAIEPVYLDCCG